MAFKVQILDCDSCDKCGVKASPEVPILELWANAYSEDSTIYVHERCLIKAIDKAKKDAAKEKLVG